MLILFFYILFFDDIHEYIKIFCEMNLLNIYIIVLILFFISKLLPLKNWYKYCDKKCMICDKPIFTVL